MQDILDKIKPIFQKYDEDKGFVTTDKAKKIIEELGESQDDSYKKVFRTMNFPKNKVSQKDIAYWIDSKNKGTGHLALIPIMGYKYLEKGKEMLGNYGFEISSSGTGQNVEAKLEANISELQVSESSIGLQLSIGGKEPEVMEELGMQPGFGIVLKLKCKDPYSGVSKIEELINQAKELVLNFVPSQVSELIEKIEIKCSTIGNDYVAVSFQFPNDHVTELAKQQKELAIQYMGDSDNQFLIDFQLATSLNLKKLIEDKAKAISDVIINQDQALRFLFKVVIPGAFASNAKKFSSILLEKMMGQKLAKYKKLINILTPIFLLQEVALELNFLSFADFLKKGEDTELLDDILDCGIKQTPVEVKESINDEFQVKETLEGAIEGMPIVQDVIEFFKDGACLDFEVVVEIGIAKLALQGKTEGVKEWFEFIMKEDEE